MKDKFRTYVKQQYAYNNHKRIKEPNGGSRTIRINPIVFNSDLVVARYNEDVAWLRPLLAKSKSRSNTWRPFRIVVYNKGDNLGIPKHQVIQLPNLGREAHTYLHHIITCWDQLAEYTIFIQGNPFDHCHNLFDCINKHLSYATVYDDFIPLGCYNCCDGNAWPHHPFPIPIAATYASLFNCTPPQNFSFVIGAQFIVSRRTIKSKPREFYERAMELVNKDQGASLGYEDNSGLTCWGYVLERLWSYIFQDKIGLNK